MSSRKKKTKSTKGRSKTTQDLNEIESQSQEQITQKSNEMNIEESFENDLLQLVENSRDTWITRPIPFYS
jgi:hypothetical protein